MLSTLRALGAKNPPKRVSGRVADPVGVDPDLDQTFEKKPDPDMTLKNVRYKSQYNLEFTTYNNFGQSILKEKFNFGGV